ncbi:MAG TPA: YoaK family protein [Bryobacteraceae bacterium]|jgi:uncharacterized membrane protein YoaK (UPF0700 family)|nr:YoaK family protein [Bryobacteraceae bacterium]
MNRRLLPPTVTAGPSPRLASWGRAFVAITLAWAAGCVDEVGWLLLDHVYVSHMTGNTAGLAYHSVSGDFTQAIHHGWPIAAFIAGLLYTAVTTRAARRRGFHSSFSIALITEIVLLFAMVALGARHLDDGHLATQSGWRFYLLISLAPAAMGIQTVTVTSVNGLRVYTTYLTGSLSKWSEAVVEYGFWVYDRGRFRRSGRLRRVLLVSYRQKPLQHAALTSGLWGGFFTGALYGAALEPRSFLLSLIAPVAVLICAAIIDIVRPIAAADEPQASDSAH